MSVRNRSVCVCGDRMDSHHIQKYVAYMGYEEHYQTACLVKEKRGEGGRCMYDGVS